MIRGNLQTARIHPMLVVGAVHVEIGSAVAPVAGQVVFELRLKVTRFFVRKDVSAVDVARPFQGRAGSVVPYSLQIRIAPGRTKRRFLRARDSGLGGSFRCLTEGRRQ